MQCWLSQKSRLGLVWQEFTADKSLLALPCARARAHNTITARARCNTGFPVNCFCNISVKFNERSFFPLTAVEFTCSWFYQEKGKDLFRISQFGGESGSMRKPQHCRAKVTQHISSSRELTYKHAQPGPGEGQGQGQGARRDSPGHRSSVPFEGEGEQKEETGAEGQRKRTIELPGQRKKKISKDKKKKRSTRLNLHLGNPNVIRNEKERKTNGELYIYKKRKNQNVYLQLLQISSTSQEYKPHPRATFAPQLRLCVAQTTPLSHMTPPTYFNNRPVPTNSLVISQLLALCCHQFTRSY